MGVRSSSDGDSRFILFFHFVPAQKFNSQTGQNLPKYSPSLRTEGCALRDC